MYNRVLIKVYKYIYIFKKQLKAWISENVIESPRINFRVSISNDLQKYKYI